MKKAHRSRGFIALTTTLILCAVLLMLMYTVSTSTFYARFDALNSEYKRISVGLSESCSNAALLKIAQNFNYAPAVGGDMVTVGSDTCMIKSVSYSNLVTSGGQVVKKTATITTQARYPTYGGSWSTNKISATVQNPVVSVTQPPPVCTLVASPASVQQGKPITVQWSASSNAVSFTLTPSPTPAIVNPGEAQTGIRTFTAGGVGSQLFTGVAINSTGGGSAPCTATVTVTAPPPAPSCADTVMMLDRTKTMSDDAPAFQALRDAAKAFLDQYIAAALNPIPYVGVGSFRGTDGSNALVPSGGRLTNVSGYASLYTIINTIYTSTADNTGTDLGAAISKAQSELMSGGLPTNKKVIVFMSDGELTGAEPSGSSSMTNWLNAADAAKIAGTQIFTISYSSNAAADRTRVAQLASGNVAISGHQAGAQDNSGVVNTNTGALNPTSTHTPNGWTSGNKGYSSDAQYATDNTANHQQGYSAFNFSIPPGSTIGGLEVLTDAKVIGTAPPVTTPTLTPTSQGSYTSWTGGESTIDETGAASCSSADSVVTNTTDARESVHLDISSIPVGSVITSVNVITYDKADATAGGTYKTFVRVDSTVTDAAANLSSNATGGSSTCNTSKSQTIDIPDVTKTGTTALQVGVIKTLTNVNAVRVGALRATINYLPPASCQLALNLSWNNGSSWSSTKTITISGVQGEVTSGASSDTWGHTWAIGDFGTGNFVVRVTNTSCTGGLTANLDGIRARAYYSGYDTSGENNDGDNFYIAPSPSDMAGIFTAIGAKVCPAIAPACSNTIDDDGDGFVDFPSDASCVDASDNDEWTAPPVPPAPPAPPAPPPISIGSWDEIIDTGP